MATVTKTFAQHVLDSVLPSDIRITKPVDKKEMTRILSYVARKHPTKYDQVVSAFKRIGDKWSTLEGLSFGLSEIAVPNQTKRDSIIKKHYSALTKSDNKDQTLKTLMSYQQVIMDNDYAGEGSKGDATLLVVSGGLGGSRHQLTKLRSTPAVFKDHKERIVSKLVDKSYAQGVGLVDAWNGSAEARSNLVKGAVQTSEPGVINKVTNNLLNSTVISSMDCRTKHGISLFTKDEAIIDRYLAEDTGIYPRGTLIDSRVQQGLLRKKIVNVVVRSPQTCEVVDNTVCSKCMGLGISSGKLHQIGDNIGIQAASAISEKSTQLVLGSKHSTTMAEKFDPMKGVKGFKQVTEMPKVFPYRQILCEIYGVIFKVFRAPQGGFNIIIRGTKPVPARYIINAQPYGDQKRWYQYFVPNQRKLEKGIVRGTEVYPGMVFTDGVPNMRDIARLKSLGAARSAVVETIDRVYKNTGHQLDRRHFEILGRQMLNYVKIEKASPSLGLLRGDVVQYNKVRSLAAKLSSRSVPLGQAEGEVLAEEVQGLTIGTELTAPLLDYLKQHKVKTVKTTNDLELSVVVTPLSRVQLKNNESIVSNLNHRWLKQTIKDAAMEGMTDTVHGYNPVTAYAYGVELGGNQATDGKY